MSELERVEELKKRVEEAEREKIRVETRLSSVKSELKKHGINSLEEGRERVKKIKEKLRILESKRDKMMNEIEEKLKGIEDVEFD